MSEPTRRTWRAGAATLTLMWIFTVASGIVIPVLAYLIYRNDASPWIPAGLGVLTVLALAYSWRFGLHPRLKVDADRVEVINPFRRLTFDWDDITVIAPGENGLIVGSDAAVAEAWCIQKSNHAARRGRLTRADRIAHELIDILEEHDPPLEDEQTGLRIRRARPDEARLLTRLERAASEETLAHIFPPEEYPYPVTAVTRRWRQRLIDRHSRVYLLELFDTPIGYVAFDKTTIQHLGVVRHQIRHGYGTALLEYASLEIYSGGAREAELWVLSDNQVARDFYRANGWVDTDDRRKSEHPPRPESIRLTKRNPSAPRRSQ